MLYFITTWSEVDGGAPLVRMYISLTVLVERSFRGWPLSPPTSDLCRSWSVSGRDTVVLETIKPSTPSCKHTAKTRQKIKDQIPVQPNAEVIIAFIAPTFFCFVPTKIKLCTYRSDNISNVLFVPRREVRSDLNKDWRFALSLHGITLLHHLSSLEYCGN